MNSCPLTFTLLAILISSLGSFSDGTKIFKTQIVSGELELVEGVSNYPNIPHEVDVGEIQKADEVSLLIHNSIRITHNVSELVFSPELKAIAEQCAEWHVTNGRDNNLPPHEWVYHCPLIAISNRPEAAESVFPHDIIQNGSLSSRSQMYRSALWNWYMQQDPNWAMPQYEPINREKVQLIWKNTTQFACATSQATNRQSMYPGTLFTSCLYSPPGNIRTKEAFAENVHRDIV